MTIRLNMKAFTHARYLIERGRVIDDDRDDWSEHAPSAADENAFIDKHDFADYAKWHLGIDDAKPDDTKGHYSFPYGDFRKVHRCAVVSGESRAGQHDHAEIEDALRNLLERIDKR